MRKEKIVHLERITTIVDSSLKNEHVDVKLGFIERLQKAHDIERRRLDAENAAALYERDISNKAWIFRKESRPA